MVLPRDRPPEHLELMARKLRWKRIQQAKRRGALKPEPTQTHGGPVKTYQASPAEIARLLAKGARDP